MEASQHLGENEKLADRNWGEIAKSKSSSCRFGRRLGVEAVFEEPAKELNLDSGVITSAMLRFWW